MKISRLIGFCREFIGAQDRLGGYVGLDRRRRSDGLASIADEDPTSWPRSGFPTRKKSPLDTTKRITHPFRHWPFSLQKIVRVFAATVDPPRRVQELRAKAGENYNFFLLQYPLSNVLT